MQVEIWSDVACPWCYVGKRRFERAVEETGIHVDVVYRSFELDPTVPPGAGPPLTEYLARKFGDLSRVQAADARLTTAGTELDIDFRWSQMHRANTFDVEDVEQFIAVRLDCQLPVGELGRNRAHRLGQVEGQLLLAELLHQAAFSSTRISSPWLITPIRSAISSASSI